MRTVALVSCIAFMACTSSSNSASDSAGATTTAQPDSPPAPPTQAPPGAGSVTERGIGNLGAGMTIAEASQAVGATLSAPAGAGDGCTYLDWPGAPAGVRLMSESGRVVRVDVQEPSTMTAAGAKVGDTQEHVTSLYQGRIAVTPHKYNATGRYLTVTPASPADSLFRIVFETENSIVTRFRAGIRPAVEYVEGCG